MAIVQVGVLTSQNKYKAPESAYTNTVDFSAVDHVTEELQINAYGVADVQFTTTGTATSNKVVIENSLDGGLNYVEVSTATDRTADGTYKETYTGLLGTVRAKQKTLTGGTSPKSTVVSIGITRLASKR